MTQNVMDLLDINLYLRNKMKHFREYGPFFRQMLRIKHEIKPKVIPWLNKSYKILTRFNTISLGKKKNLGSSGAHSALGSQMRVVPMMSPTCRVHLLCEERALPWEYLRIAQ